MFRSRRCIVTSLLSGAVAVGIANFAPISRPAFAADTPVKDADKDKDHMTRADRVRDALEHLKKAEEQLKTANVDEKGHDGAAYLQCKKAIEECDKYLEQVGEGKKAQ